MLSGKSIRSVPQITEVSKPRLSDNEILVTVRATAINPIDVKFVDFIAPPGSLLGCDFSGEVSEVGKTASQRWKVGDRVAGFVQGGVTKEHGSFAEFVKAEADLVWRIPQTTSFESASTFGVPAATAMQALHVHLDIPWSNDNRQFDKKASTILIHAGSSSVGLFAIQLAKRAGLTVITTASPHSFNLVKSYGADHVFDHHSETVVKDVLNQFPGISRALDCFSEGESTEICGQIVQRSAGKVITLLDTKAKITGVEIKMIMSFQLLGKEFAWLAPIGPKFPVSESEREALVRFYDELPKWELKSPPLIVLENGFDGILDGLNRIRERKVSGSKLVVTF